MMKKGKATLFIAVSIMMLVFGGCGKADTANLTATEDGTVLVEASSDDGSTQEETAGITEFTEDGSKSDATEETIQTEDSGVTMEDTEKMLQMKIDDTIVNVSWEENESVDALMDMCKDSPIEIRMSMYGGFEQVGFIGTSLPRKDVQTTTSSGDIVLYSGNQIVVFYGSNSWSYTRLGHITDQDNKGMTELLSDGDVTITLSVE